MRCKLNILFTSVGRRSYLVEYFKEALNGKGSIHVANSSAVSPAFQVADKSIVTPLIYADDYIPFLIKYCKENDIGVIISLFDIDLMILAKNKDVFAEIGVKVIVSDERVIEICNDKWNTYKFLINNGFKAPVTFLNIETALENIEKGVVKYPLMIKPRWGMGSIAVYQADNEEELKIFFEKTRRNIFDSYLKYESNGDKDNCVLIQEKICGQEYGLDIINDLEGKYVNTIVKMKYAMRAGETDCAVTVDNSNIKKIGEILSSKLNHIANLDTDIFVNEDGIYVLEMNARFGGGYPFSHMAGVNLPLAILKWLCDENVDESLFTANPNVMVQKDIRLVCLDNNTKK